ncbi:small multidrug efflux protein [Labedella populi]|uniref:Small multidrug efflux protein n=1 Tax=Labedella populi TaxID=2498850 RepID=A0A444QE65_9MICO|nr:small multidrug efflux protein [Labedella populi]RWZ67828.1 small multidrug efflux protein [Labedella populi]
MDNPYQLLQSTIHQVPELLQPAIVALAGMVPYIEGEGAAAFGILVGIHPVVAAMAGATGNILCVVAVVLLGSRIRGAFVSRRAARAGATAPRPASTHTPLVEDRPVVAAPLDESAAAPTSTLTSTTAMTTTTDPRSRLEKTVGPGRTTDKPAEKQREKASRGAKGRAKLRRWMVRFGVPGASLLAPLALPTMLTAAFFVSSGVRKGWVILWQVVAIVLWTTLIAVAATGALAALGW